MTRRESWLSQVKDGDDTPLEKLEREDATTTCDKTFAQL